MRERVLLLILILALVSTTGCVFAYRQPDAAPEAVPQRALGLPGHPENVWTDAASGAEQTIPLTNQTFIELAEQANPAVVNIFTETDIRTRVGDPLGLFTIRTPNLDFQAQALGSGFIISPDGFLLTNAHVVVQADKIKVFLWRESQVKEARLIGLDRSADIALLKIEPDHELPYLRLADSDIVRVGEVVAAIGNPFGLNHSLTDGLISAKHRRIHDDQRAWYEDFLQTSAQINPGNSGGPLLNLSGDVVGVNTAIVAGGQGIGFAVPSNLVKEILPHLVRGGRVRPAYVGVKLADLPPDRAARLGLEDLGAVIAEVLPGTPAAAAGFQPEDVVVAVNDVPIRDAAVLARKLNLLPIGREARVTVLRNGRRLTITVVPVTPPAPND